MAELEKAARQALEQLEFLNACYPHKTAADTIAALTQALATAEPKLHGPEWFVEKRRAAVDRIASMPEAMQQNMHYAAATLPATTERKLVATPDHNGALVPASPVDMQVYDKIAAGYWTERKGEPAKSLVIQCPMCSDFDPDAACHFCSLLSVHDVEEWRNVVAIARPVPNTGMVPVKARTILAVDRLIANAVAAQAQPTNTSPQVPEDVQKDAERYRFLAEKCRSTSEHWGGRWSIVIEGPAPKSHDSEDDLDEAIDAARKGE